MTVPKLLRDLGIRQQLGLAAAVITLVSTLVLVYLMTLSSRHIASEQTKIISLALAEQLATQVDLAAVNQDELALAAILNRALRADWMSGAVLTNDRGDVIARVGQTRPTFHSVPVTVDNTVRAQLKIYYGHQLASELRAQQTWTLAGLAVLIAAVMGGLGAQLGQMYSRSLTELKRQIPSTVEAIESANEIDAISKRLMALPLELLAQQTDLQQPPAAINPTVIVIVSLDSLEHYVDTLNEDSLERYTQRLYQCLHTATSTYGGKLRVVRQLRVALIFSDQGGRQAARSAIQAALLMQMLCKRQEDSSHLRYQVRCVLGRSDLKPLDDHSFYADLYVQNIFDHLEQAFQQDGLLWLESDLIDQPPFDENYQLGPLIQQFTSVVGIPPETKQLLAEQAEKYTPKIS